MNPLDYEYCTRCDKEFPYGECPCREHILCSYCDISYSKCECTDLFCSKHLIENCDKCISDEYDQFHRFGDLEDVITLHVDHRILKSLQGLKLIGEYNLYDLEWNPYSKI